MSLSSTTGDAEDAIGSGSTDSLGQREMSGAIGPRSEQAQRTRFEGCVSTRATRHQQWILGPFLALLVVLTLIAYGDTPANWFVRDDFVWLYNAGLQAEDWSAFFTIRPFRYFRPVGNLFFGVEYHFLGLEARGYHLVNMGLHAWNAAWLGILAFTLYRDRLAASLASILFVCSPAWDASVHWISSFTILLAAGALLPTLVCHARFLRGGRWPYYGATIIGSVLCIGSHEIGIAVGPLLLLIECKERGTGSFLRRRTMLRYLPFALLAGLYAMAQQKFIDALVGSEFTLGHFVTSFGQRCVATVSTMLLPEAPGTYEAQQVTGAGVLLALLVLLRVLGGRKRLHDGIGLTLGLLVSFLPFVVAVNLDAALGNRYSYTPALALCLLLGTTGGLMASQLQRLAGRAGKIVPAVASLVLLAWVASNVLQIRDHSASSKWRDSSQQMHELVEELREAVPPVRERPVHGAERWLFLGLPMEPPQHFTYLAAVFLGVPRENVEHHRLSPRERFTGGPSDAWVRGIMDTHHANRVFLFVDGVGLLPYDESIDASGANDFGAALTAPLRRPNALRTVFVLAL